MEMMKKWRAKMRKESLIHKILRKLGFIKDIEDDRIYILGEYSTEEKAIKAMKMCREQYSQCEFNKLVITKTDENLAKVSISLTGEVRNQLADKYLFQFPADDEI